MAKSVQVNPNGGNLVWTIESDNNLSAIIIYDAFLKDKNGGDARQEWKNQDTYNGTGTNNIVMSASELADGSWMAFIASGIDPNDVGGNHTATIKFFQDHAQLGDNYDFPFNIPPGSGPHGKFGDVFKFVTKG